MTAESSREMSDLGKTCSRKHDEGGGWRSELCFSVANPEGWSLAWELAPSQAQSRGTLTTSWSHLWTLLVTYNSSRWAQNSLLLLKNPCPAMLAGIWIHILCSCIQDHVREVTTQVKKSKFPCLWRWKIVNPPTKSANNLQIENVLFTFYPYLLLSPPQYGLYRANGDLLFMGMCDSCETTVPMQKGCAAMGNGQREEIRIIWI